MTQVARTTIGGFHDPSRIANEANWVPTPSDEFSLYIRAYWPKDAILDGSWKPPMVVRAT